MWQLVCPLVQQLRNYYEYAIELETALCDILTELCNPDMSAVEHLEKQQVCVSVNICRVFVCVCIYL